MILIHVFLLNNLIGGSDYFYSSATTWLDYLFESVYLGFLSSIFLINYALSTLSLPGA